MRLTTLIVLWLTAIYSLLGPACCTPGSAAERPPTMPADSALSMMDSTVFIRVEVNESVITEEKLLNITRPKASPRVQKWFGSAVVYGKTDPKDGPVKTRILSAKHVLYTEPIGPSVLEVPLRLFSMVIGTEHVRTDAVKITATSIDGKTCGVKMLVGGDLETRDVAVGEIDCDMGRVAKIASSSPIRGEQITIVGHPHGWEPAIVTQGFVGGWDKGYLVTSAPVAPGNSGGPVFYNGEVAALLVRVDTSYPNVSLCIGAETLRRYVAQASRL